MHNPTILLLGGGYTLERVAQLLPANTFVITSRSRERCDIWRTKGWLSHPVSLEDGAELINLFKTYPSIKVLVDGVPPLHQLNTDERSNPAESGVRNVIKALTHSSIERIIYLSTTGVFGTRDGSWVDEVSPPNPWNPLAAARLACEQLYRSAARDLTELFKREVLSISLRLPAIYGPDRGVLHSLKAGNYSLVGDGSQWTNRIHVEDLSLIIQRLIDYRGQLPPVLCINDDNPTQACQVISYLCERFQLRWPPSISPDEVARRGAFTMLSNQRVSNQRMKDLLGITLRYPSFKDAAEAN
jgi:nucleoside-diphosphate-sugar epimerase